jgi:flagellar biosynthesis protein FlhF
VSILTRSPARRARRAEAGAADTVAYEHVRPGASTFGDPPLEDPTLGAPPFGDATFESPSPDDAALENIGLDAPALEDSAPVEDSAPDYAPALRESPRIYTGRTLDELIPRIVAELGSDAVVLRHERGLAGGFAGFFRRPFVEIEAARGVPRFDRYDDEEEEYGAVALPAAPGETVEAGADDLRDTESFQGIEPFSSSESFRDDEPVRNSEFFWESASPPSTGGFAAELASAEAMGPVVVEDLHDQASLDRQVPPDRGGSRSELAPTPTAPSETGRLAPQCQLPAGGSTGGRVGADRSAAPAAQQPLAVSSGPARAAIERTLLGAGVDEQLVREVLGAAVAHVLPLLDPSSPPPLALAARRALAQQIPVCRPLPSSGAVIAFVGPGGAGKSTCCAVLLDAYYRRSTLPAARATLVPRALGAAAAGEPGGAEPAEGLLDVLFAPHAPEPIPLEEPLARQALARARTEGLLLLDTPALSPTDGQGIAALAATLARLAPDRVVLTLPATLGARSAAQLLEAYRSLGTSALAVTHVDETDQLGVAVHVGSALGIAPAYLLEGGAGGFVLTQVEPADLARRLLGPG